jgi:Mn-dependent DtxR family transcriptional regulator
MVRRLAEQGLLAYEPYRGVTLTATGRTAALRTIRRHRVLESYLTTVLGYAWDRVHEEAERLEHAASDELVDRMARALGDPAVDPHGAPIPTREGRVDETVHGTLAEVGRGGAGAGGARERQRRGDAALPRGARHPPRHAALHRGARALRRPDRGGGGRRGAVGGTGAGGAGARGARGRREDGTGGGGGRGAEPDRRPRRRPERSLLPGGPQRVRHPEEFRIMSSRQEPVRIEPDVGIPDLIRRLTDDSKRLASDEVQLAKLELSESIHSVSRGTLWLAVAFGPASWARPRSPSSSRRCSAACSA